MGFQVSALGPMWTYNTEEAADGVDIWVMEIPRFSSLSLVYNFHLCLEAELNLLHKEFWRKMGLV